MQNGDDFGFRGCDRENCGLMWGRKEKKDGDFVGRRRGFELVAGCGVWWGLGDVGRYKRVNKSDN